MSKLIASLDADRAVDDDCAACGSCPANDDRRRFLADAARVAIGALVMLGARQSKAAQLPVGFVRALEGSRADVKRYAVPAADGVSIDKDAEVILVRWQNAVYAFALSCPHQNTALRWVDADQ